MIFSIQIRSAQMMMHLLIPTERKAWSAQYAGSPSTSLRMFPMYYGVVTLCVRIVSWAAIKFPTLPIQLPFFISCPWCNLLSPRMLYKGAIRFPQKNYFILWMVESMNGDRDFRQPGSSNGNTSTTNYPHVRNNPEVTQSPERRELNNVSLVRQYFNRERFNMSLRKSLAFIVHLAAKFPVVLIFLLVTFYAIPASAAILSLYLLITVLFALPSFLVLYFAYPSLDWLVREILT